MSPKILAPLAAAVLAGLFAAEPASAITRCERICNADAQKCIGYYRARPEVCNGRRFSCQIRCRRPGNSPILHR